MTRSSLKDRASVPAGQLRTGNPLDSSLFSGPVSPIALTPQGGLRLEWVEGGRIKTWLIHQHLGQIPARVRLGQNSLQCDVVLADASVARLHGEIFFDLQRQRFYFWNLYHNGITIVNGLLRLTQGEAVVLTQGSRIQLGQVTLQVAALSSGRTSTSYRPILVAPKREGSRPGAPTRDDSCAPKADSQTEARVTVLEPVTPRSDQGMAPPTPQASRSTLNHRPETAGSRSGSSLSTFKTQLLMAATGGAILSGLVGGYLGLRGLRLSSSRDLEPIPSGVAVEPQGSCQTVAPTSGEDARLFAGPSREAFTGERINRDTRVGLLGEEAAFAEIQLLDGRRLWVFNDQILPCEALEEGGNERAEGTSG